MTSLASICLPVSQGSRPCTSWLVAWSMTCISQELYCLQVVIENDYWRVQRRLLQVSSIRPCQYAKHYLRWHTLKGFLWPRSLFLRRSVTPFWLAWFSVAVWTL